MDEKLTALPASAWRSIIRWTLVITALSVVASVAVSEILLNTLSSGINAAGLATAIILPIILGGPAMFFQTLRHQQLKHANARLIQLASTDWLTGCLNRRSFTHRTAASLQAGTAAGALLMIDADHFKAINDTFGHERGDEALILLAMTIKAAVRDTDLVGRLGGEEFGVFLPDAGHDIALTTAERIRSAVSRLDFGAAPALQPLTVSVGGACFAGSAAFSELFRLADQRLYAAKQAGRNRIEMLEISPNAAIAGSPPRRPRGLDKTASASV